MKYILLTLISFTFFSAEAFPDSSETKIEQADAYFNAGRYWEAFLLYKEAANTDSYLMSKIEDTKKCMILDHKYKVNRDLKKYAVAIENLQDLVGMNPNEPNKYDLGVMAYLHARNLQQKAYSQKYKEDARAKLKEASAYYRLALEEGINPDEIIPSLKLCEKQLYLVTDDAKPRSQSEIESEIRQSLDIRDQEIKTPVERTRKVQILESQE